MVPCFPAVRLTLLSRASARIATKRLPPAPEARPTRRTLAAGGMRLGDRAFVPHRVALPCGANHRPSVRVLLPAPVGHVSAKESTWEVGLDRLAVAAETDREQSQRSHHRCPMAAVSVAGSLVPSSGSRDVQPVTRGPQRRTWTGECAHVDLVKTA